MKSIGAERSYIVRVAGQPVRFTQAGTVRLRDFVKLHEATRFATSDDAAAMAVSSFNPGTNITIEGSTCKPTVEARQPELL
jgi:hypothetical protein